MRHTNTLLRPGMTAIAAVLALSSTPLLAQAVEVAPVVTTPDVSDPVPSAPATTAVPNAAGLNIPKITVNLDDAPQTALAVEPEATPAASTRATTARAAKPVQSTAPPAPAPRAAATTTPSAPAPMTEQLAAPVPVPVIAEPVIAPAPQPVAKAQPVDNDVLPLAGAAGLAALALAGGAFALTRRKRRDEDFEAVSEAAPVELDDRNEVLLTQPAPVFVAAAPMVAPKQPEGPVTAVPAGFDLSRFGRHVQAAYQGPTPENPSLSLKNRLRRASFYDQRERMAAAPAVEQPAVRDRVVTTRPEPAMARQTDQVVTRPSNRPQPGFRPAYQS